MNWVIFLMVLLSHHLITVIAESSTFGVNKMKSKIRIDTGC